jgi:16S rRNA processing protein RimM
MTNKILIGKITSSHGIKGQVKILSLCQNPQDIQNYQPLFDKNDQELKIKITSKPQGANKNIFIATISGVIDRNQSEALHNDEIFVNKDQFQETQDDEFYCSDLIGMNVVDENKDKIGKVIDVVNYGAGDIVEIEFKESSGQKEQIQMFSFRDEIFPEINIEEEYILIVFPDTVQIK